jgi:putative transposase
VGLSRSLLAYEPAVVDDTPLMRALSAAVERYPRYGFRKLYRRVRQAGHPWNHKRLWRVYCAMGLNVRRRHKRPRPRVPYTPLLQPLRPNQRWSADFMSDALYGGGVFRTFNLIDDYNREGLRIEIDRSLTAPRVTRILDQVISVRGAPESLRLDNGPEFTSGHFAEWAEAHAITLEFIQPGKPTQNAFVERFNGTYRREVLDAWAFRTLDEVRETTEQWLAEYNTERPHETLGDLTPIEFLNQRGHPNVSIYGWI